MTDDTVPDDDHRGMARRAGYSVFHRGTINPHPTGFYIGYAGPDPARRALRDIGPYDNEADAWARAVGLAMTYRGE